MKRRPVLVMLAATLGLPAVHSAAPSGTKLQAWKDPHCGCCQAWIGHLQAHGFTVEAHDMGNTAARKRLGLPERLGSCHTAWVGGYAIEGHVPAADIERLLKRKPSALGLAVPGMPVGSPGMDAPVYKGRKDAFQVLLVQRDGSTSVFASYAGSAAARQA
ncbi:MAG: DUF411 domain-containing protein [Betaproteobacteria bacterium]